jgi:hypothetical protein
MLFGPDLIGHTAPDAEVLNLRNLCNLWFSFVFVFINRLEWEVS